MDLRRNMVGNLEAGVVVGLTGAANRFIVYGIPGIYDIVVGSLGRWGEPVMALVMGFAIDFAGERIQFIEQRRIPSRWFIYGVYRLVEEAFNLIGGRGFAHIAKDGSVKTDPSDDVRKIYMQKGDGVVEVEAGSRSAVIGPRRYVVVGQKRVYYFEAPYELSGAGGSS
jgi:hypothetical protein